MNLKDTKSTKTRKTESAVWFFVLRGLSGFVVNNAQLEESHSPNRALARPAADLTLGRQNEIAAGRFVPCPIILLRRAASNRLLRSEIHPSCPPSPAIVAAL